MNSLRPDLKELEIILHERIAENTRHLRLGTTPGTFQSFTPGMFSMISPSDSFDPLLNRPFSLSLVNTEKGWFDIIYRIVGKGTRILSHKEKGQKIKIMAPLGHGFPVKKREFESIILIGGGIGIAPLLSLFSHNPQEVFGLFWGIKNQNEFFDIKKLCAIPEKVRIQMATEDGSMGYKGTVLEAFRIYLREQGFPSQTAVFACGPTRMLHSLHDLCVADNIPLFVSMETRMACGMGYCLGCALPDRVDGYLKTCSDGPVFFSRLIDWDKMHDGD